MRTIESMPFQTFQLALDVIRKDRVEKLSMIAAERAKIAHVMQHKGLTPQSTEIRSMLAYIENLKIMADINSPRVKYNFDTGLSQCFPPSVCLSLSLPVLIRCLPACQSA